MLVIGIFANLDSKLAFVNLCAVGYLMLRFPRSSLALDSSINYKTLYLWRLNKISNFKPNSVSFVLWWCDAVLHLCVVNRYLPCYLVLRCVVSCVVCKDISFHFRKAVLCYPIGVQHAIGYCCRCRCVCQITRHTPHQPKVCVMAMMMLVGDDGDDGWRW